jgi:hypothetical protein
VRKLVLLVAACSLLAACGSSTPAARSHPSNPNNRATGAIPTSLLARERPIGRGPRFQPELHGSVTGICTAPLGRRDQVHVEIFGANRVVLLPAGIGTRPPRRLTDGRVVGATCFGALVTLDPTGIVYLRPGHRVTLGDLFDAWGQPLTAARIASFTGGPVRVYVNGRQQGGAPRTVPLTTGSEVVLEVGPHVPPHRGFTFPPTPAPGLR